MDCPKKAYRSPTEVRAAIARYRVRHLDTSRIDIYYCHQCRRWHFGHTKRAAPPWPRRPAYRPALRVWPA